MILQYKLFCAGIAICVFAATVISCSRPSAHVNIRIGIATWPGFAAGVVGNEKKLFTDIDVENSILDDAPARHAAYQSGQLDIMVSSADVFIQELDQGIKGQIILVTDESLGGDGIVAKDGINSAADLRGKRVAFARATPSHYFLAKFLAKSGMSLSDIEAVIVPDPANAGQAFLGGSVDAAVSFEPFLNEITQQGKGHLLATTKDFPGTIVDVLVASPKLIARPDVLNRFVQGWLASVDYIKRHPEESTKIIAKGLKVSDSDASGMMAGLQFADGPQNLSYMCASEKEPPLIRLLLDAANFAKAQGIIKTLPDVNQSASKAVCEIVNATPASP